MNEPQKDLVIEARELVAKATPGPFEVYPIKTMKGDIAGFVWGKYLSDQKDADHFWSSELVPFDDAQMYARAPELLRQLADEVERRDELIVHMYVHSGYRNNGYLQMTTPQKALYDGIWKRSVEELDKEESND